MTFDPLLNSVTRFNLAELTYSSVPESASQFNSLQQDRFGFFKTQIATQAKAKTHGTKAGRWDLDVSEGECLDHICEIDISMKILVDASANGGRECRLYMWSCPSCCPSTTAMTPNWIVIMPDIAEIMPISN